MRLLMHYCYWADRHPIGWMVVSYVLAPCLGGMSYLAIREIINLLCR